MKPGYNFSFIFYSFVCACVFAKVHPPGNITTKIVGGIEARRGEFPWIVLIRHDGDHTCAGSIINHYWIVTAAHCSDLEITGYTLTAGEHDLRISEGSEQNVTVDRIIVHPDYNRNTYAHDIAVWKVNIPFKFSVYVHPVALAGGFNILDFFASIFIKDGVTAGWGTLSFGGISSMVLRKVTLPLISTSSCRSSFQDITEIVDGMLCAGSGKDGRDSCQGDSGGPLVRFQTLIGVISIGIGCSSGYPGIYADVAYYVHWILSEVIN